jgi:hypothetical protein
LKEKTERQRRREIRSEELLDDLKENRRYCNLKEEALDHTLWRTRLAKGYGPVTRWNRL